METKKELRRADGRWAIVGEHCRRGRPYLMSAAAYRAFDDLKLIAARTSTCYLHAVLSSLTATRASSSTQRASPWELACLGL